MRIHVAALVVIASGCGSSGDTNAQGDTDATSESGDSSRANDSQSTGDTHVDEVSSDAGLDARNDAIDATSPDVGGKTACKRGMATNAAPSAAFAASAGAPGVAWWYDWSPSASGASPIEFVPMIWGEKSLASALPTGASAVLGFNEPNFKAQSNLTPTQAATDWPKVVAAAKGVGARVVSPAVNFCGSATDPSRCSDPTITDPYTWLKDFFAACPGCEVDAIAVHWYNCDLPSLKAYIEGGTTLEGFVHFGKPIWLTEFSCDGSHSVADQKAYMEAAVPWLEANAHVERYAWFSADPIPNAKLANADRSPTDLGNTYIGLAQSCP
jgi:hypothetical protein